MQTCLGLYSLNILSERYVSAWEVSDYISLPFTESQNTTFTFYGISIGKCKD